MGKLFEPDGLLNRIADIIIGIFLTGLLVFVCCIPMVTFTASLTAGYYAMVKCVRKSAGYVFREFFRSFKSNFLASLPFSIIGIVLALLTVFDVLYLKNSTQQLESTLVVVVFVIAFMAACVLLVLSFVLSRFNMKGMQLLKFSMLLAFRHFLSTAAMLIFMLLSVFLTYLMPWGFCLFPGLALYGSTFLMERVMKKYMPKPEEGSKEADIWYNKT